MKIARADEQHKYRRDGFCVIEGALTPGELQMLSSTADQLLAEPPIEPDGRYHDISRGTDRQFFRMRLEEVPELASFVLGPRMRDLATALLNAPLPYLFVEQFVVKGPQSGASFAWHQDSGYVDFDHEPYLSVWIAIDDATPETGCLSVLPAEPDQPATVVPHQWDETNKERVGYAGDDAGTSVACKAGSIVAFSSLTMFRSLPNTTDRPRRAYLCQFSASPIIDPETQRAKHFAKPLEMPLRS